MTQARQRYMEVVDVKRFEFQIDCINAEHDARRPSHEFHRCIADVAALRLLGIYRPLFDTLDRIDRLLSCVYWHVGCSPYAPPRKRLPVGPNRAQEVRELTSAEMQERRDGMNTITDDIIARTNAQRKRLHKPLLNRAGCERAVQDFGFDHSPDVLVIALVDWVIPTGNMHEYSSAFEVPRGQRSVIL